MRSVLRTAVVMMALTGAAASRATAQVPSKATVDSLQRTVMTLTARLDSLEAGHCPAGPAPTFVAPKPTGNASIDSLAAAVARLSTRVNAAVASRCALAAAPAAPAADTAQDPLAAIRAAADSTAVAAGAPAVKDSTPAAPTQFVSRQRNQSSMNPEISATGDVQFAAQSDIQGLDMQLAEVEVALQATLDPYSFTKIFLTWGQDGVGVEEAYIYWTGLPAHSRADIGKFRMPVGDLNRWHRHALPETNYPLVYQEYLSPDGLSGVGASLYTALPFPSPRAPRRCFSRARPSRAGRSRTMGTSRRSSPGCRISGNFPVVPTCRSASPASRRKTATPT